MREMEEVGIREQNEQMENREQMVWGVIKNNLVVYEENTTEMR